MTTKTAKETCCYVRKDGTTCPGDQLPISDFCFWHDSDALKEGQDIKERLENWGNSGASMEGFVLKYADLEGLKFNALPHGQWVNLSHADLYHANLRHAHLYHANLHQASLMKADLSHANLNMTNLRNADLLGARFDGTKMEHIKWGDKIKQELKAEDALLKGDFETAKEQFLEAEEVYRDLYRECEKRKFLEEAGHFFHKEMHMRHRQLKRLSLDWWWSILINGVCGYGERPARVVAFSLAIIFAMSILYFLIGISGPTGLIVADTDKPLVENIITYGSCLYFSVVTFTTLGYGDITPLGIGRIFAATEAFIGSFTIALFVVVFVRKMSR